MKWWAQQDLNLRPTPKAFGAALIAEPPVKQWAQRDLNPRPSDYESPALTAELWALPARLCAQGPRPQAKMPRASLGEHLACCPRHGTGTAGESSDKNVCAISLTVGRRNFFRSCSTRPCSTAPLLHCHHAAFGL